MKEKKEVQIPLSYYFSSAEDDGKNIILIPYAYETKNLNFDLEFGQTKLSTSSFVQAITSPHQKLEPKDEVFSNELDVTCEICMKKNPKDELLMCENCGDNFHSRCMTDIVSDTVFFCKFCLEEKEKVNIINHF